MNVVTLINNEKIPWVIIKQVSEYNRRSIHGFVCEDKLVFETIIMIKNCFAVKYYGGMETIMKLRALYENLQKLQNNHPDWKCYNKAWEETTTKMLGTYVKMARNVVSSTPPTMVEDPHFISFWCYIAEILETLLEGCKRSIYHVDQPS